MKVILDFLKTLIKTLQYLETEISLPCIDLYCSSSEHANGGKIKPMESNRLPKNLSHITWSSIPCCMEDARWHIKCKNPSTIF